MISPAASPTPRDRTWEPTDAVLVVADRVPRPGLRDDDRRLADLLVALTQLSPSITTTLLVLDAAGAAEHAPPLQALGVDVVAPPRDWDRWFAGRPGCFSVVVVHGRTAARRFDVALSATQPQARRVVDATVLGHRERFGLEGLFEAVDAGGARFAAAARLEYEQQLLLDADAMLCRSLYEEREVARVGVRGRVVCVPGVAEPRTATPGWEERRGVVLVGSFLDGLSSPDEDAVLFFTQHVLPTLRRIDPSIPVTVVGEDTTPVLDLLPGVEVLAPGADPAAVLDAARVVAIQDRYGRVPFAAVRLALEASVPFVAGPFTASALGVGGLLVATADPRQFAIHLARVALDREVWELARHEANALARERFAASAHLRAVADVFASLGVAPRDPRTWNEPADVASFVPAWSCRGARRWRPDPSLATGVEPLRLRMPDVVQTDGLRRSSNEPEEGAGEVSYDAWRRARACTPSARAIMARELAGFGNQPLVSIVTPVFNTKPDLLAEAIESVRDQVYERWELCLADDGSTNPSTIEVLQRYALADPRIRVVHLAANEGIVGASNAALACAKGEFVALLDHDDVLDPAALFEVVRLLNQCPELDFVYSDEDKIDESGRYCNPAFKPAWSPDLLMSTNYVTHFAVYRRALVDKVGGFRPGFDGSQDYDLALRVVEQTDRIGHVAKPLYAWRMVPGSTSADSDAKPYALEAGARALSDALVRRGRRGTVEQLDLFGAYRVGYEITASQRISIVIPTRDRLGLLQTCITSIQERSTYRNFEIVVIDNESTDPATLEYLAALDGRVIRYPHLFNFARMMNFAAEQLETDQLLFLNNDVEVINSDWLEAMLEHSQRPEVGAVGARLYFPDGRKQHEGIFVGYAGGAGNVDFGGAEHPQAGVHFAGINGSLVRNFAAVTAACMMIRPTVLWDVGGFEERLCVTFNDVDLCLKIRQRGYEIVYTPYAELIHNESASRGAHHPMEDDHFLRRRWDITDEYHDPYYSPNYHNRRAFVLQP